MIKTIVLDLDGTLLNDEKRIGDLSKRNIKRLRNEGMQFVLASGRHLRDMIKYAEELGFQQGDYLISCDGQYIYNFNGDEIWHAECLTAYDVKEILKTVNIKNGMLFDNECDWLFYGNIIIGLFVKLLFLLRKSSNMQITRVSELTDRQYEKVRFFKFGISDKKINIVAKQFTVHSVFNKYWDVTANNVNKYIALRKMDDSGTIDLDSSLFFGDDYNDIECFKKMSHCVAVQSACKEIRELASEITKSNVEDGVGYYLNSL